MAIGSKHTLLLNVLLFWSTAPLQHFAVFNPLCTNCSRFFFLTVFFCGFLSHFLRSSQLKALWLVILEKLQTGVFQDGWVRFQIWNLCVLAACNKTTSLKRDWKMEAMRKLLKCLWWIQSHSVCKTQPASIVWWARMAEHQPSQPDILPVLAPYRVQTISSHVLMFRRAGKITRRLLWWMMPADRRRTLQSCRVISSHSVTVKHYKEQRGTPGQPNTSRSL